MEAPHEFARQWPPKCLTDKQVLQLPLSLHSFSGEFVPATARSCRSNGKQSANRCLSHSQTLRELFHKACCCLLRTFQSPILEPHLRPLDARAPKFVQNCASRSHNFRAMFWGELTRRSRSFGTCFCASFGSISLES